MGWRSRALKNWRALGPWFHKRLMILWKRCGVHWIVLRAWGRPFGGVLRIRLVMFISSSGSGAGVVVTWREDMRDKIGKCLVVLQRLTPARWANMLGFELGPSACLVTVVYT